MQLTRTSRGFAALTGLVVFALAGCSGSDKKATPATSSQTTVVERATTTTASAPDVAGDTARAEAAVLRLSDLPTGWTGTPPTPSDEENETAQVLADCLGVDIELVGGGDIPKGSSEDFTGPDGEFLLNGVVILPTEDEAIASVDVFADPAFVDCYERSAVGDSTGSFDGTAGVENGRGVLSGTLTLGGNGSQLDFETGRVDRAVAFLLQGSGEGPDGVDVSDLLDVVLERLSEQ